MNSRRTAGLMFWGGLGLSAYSYVGYPVGVAVAAAVVKRARSPQSGTDPASAPIRVTVIIAAHRESAVIGDRIRNLFDTTYPAESMEIIVAVDDDPATVSVVNDLVRAGLPSPVTVLHSPVRQGKSAAITRAAAQASGDVVVFSDANNHYKPDTLGVLVAAFEDPRVGAVTGAKQTVGTDGIVGEGAYWRYEDWIRRSESALGCCTGVNGEIFAVRRSAFSPIPDDVINDDFWIAMQVLRAGLDVRYEPAAISSEPGTRDLVEDGTRRRRIAAGRWQAIGRPRETLPWRRPVVLLQVVSHKVLRLVVPFAFVGAGLGAVAASLRPGRRVGVRGLARPWGLLACIGMTAFCLVSARAGRRLASGASVSMPERVLAFVWSTNRSQLEGAGTWLSGAADARWDRVERSHSIG
jgi:poly-beta-1,6-N-acetyl-D-glucosamine synthase